MLQSGHLPLTAAEHDAVHTLAAKNPAEPISMTRRDPGETGPLLVHVAAKTWEIATDGKRKKVA